MGFCVQINFIYYYLKHYLPPGCLPLSILHMTTFNVHRKTLHAEHRTHRVSTCDDGGAHVLETILADVELG